GKRALRIPDQGVVLASSPQARGFGKLLRISRPGLGAYRAGSKDHPDDTRVLLLRLIAANCGPTGAMPDQHDLFKSALLREVNPRGEVLHVLAGDPPITAAADSLLSPPREHVPQIMHARVASETGVAALSQSASNGNVGG